MFIKTDKIPVPVRSGEYTTIFRPVADVFKRSSTPSFERGKFYEKWVVNDFCCVKGEGAWHLIGITHPCPPDFADDCNFNEVTVHEAETQLFHAVAQGEKFSELLRENSFREEPKILWPEDRPGEAEAIYAPHCQYANGEYQLLYAPDYLRRATSKNLYDWTARGPMFRGNTPEARDPNVFQKDDGTFIVTYTDNDGLWTRETRDFVTFGEQKQLQPRLFDSCEQESPVLFKRGKYYYLLWSVYDGKFGCYDHRTYVFAADSIEGLYRSAPVTMLDSHATEIVEQDGEWYILSVFYPENGVSACRLEWK